MEHLLAERLRVVRLIDAYGRVLTSRQQRLLRLYYLDDLSLGEIADKLDITRQAVFDSLRRSVRELQRMEELLQLLEVQYQSARRRKQVVARLEALRDAVSQLEGQVEQKALARVLEELTALRQVVS